MASHGAHGAAHPPVPSHNIPQQHSQAEFEERKNEIQEQKEFHELLRNMMYDVQIRRTYATGLAHVCLSFLTAPLLTLSTSLQVSSPMARVTLNDLTSGTMNAKLGQQGGLADQSDKRVNRAQKFMQLNLKDKGETVRQNRSLSLWQPFRAASYNSYGEALKGLYRQGTPLSFYKGNGVRAAHILLFHKLNADLTFQIEKLVPGYWKQIRQVPLLPELILSCLADMLLQPLHVAEARFILQNRQANFSAYRSLLDFFKKTPLQDVMRANLLHLPRNFLVALQGARLTDQMSMPVYYAQVVGSQTLAYPVMLLQRRKECLTSSDYLRGRGFQGTAEVKSVSVFSLAQQVFREDGFRSFYKGYTAYMFAIVFWAAALPAATDAMLKVYPYLQSLRNRKSREELIEQQQQMDALEAMQKHQEEDDFGDFDDDDNEEYDSR